jgi:hypothetical protein
MSKNLIIINKMRMKQALKMMKKIKMTLSILKYQNKIKKIKKKILK